MSDTKFLCIHRSRSGDTKAERPSPAEMEAMYTQFNAWMEKYKKNIVDMGGKLKGPGKILSAAGAKDGPFVETKELIGGYMIISAKNMKEAIQIVRESPAAVDIPGISVEIREIHVP